LRTRQVFVALGAALMYGAQESWIADELAQETTTHVYVRAGQLGLVGTVVGSLGSGFLALAGLGLRLPLLAGGVLMVLRRREVPRTGPGPGRRSGRGPGHRY
jgi:hypothetical protein